MPGINQELRDLVIKGYAEGRPLQEIADEAGVEYHSIRSMGSRLNLVHRRDLWREREMKKSRNTPQYEAWLKAKEGASKTLQELSP